MTAHPPAAHSHPPAQRPSASTPALPVDESDDLTGPGGNRATTGERIIDRIEWADIARIAVVGLASLGVWAASAAGAPRGARVPVSLSPREREVLAAVSRGLSNSQIGVELYITEATVKTHLLRAYAKLGVDSRAAAVTEALRRGLLELE